MRFSGQEYCSRLPFPSPSWPRNRAHLSCVGRRILYYWAIRETPLSHLHSRFLCTVLSKLCHVSVSLEICNLAIKHDRSQGTGLKMETAATQAVVWNQVCFLVPFFIKMMVFIWNQEYFCKMSFASLIKVQFVVCMVCRIRCGWCSI